jgi:hypothetical protein
MVGEAGEHCGRFVSSETGNLLRFPAHSEAAKKLNVPIGIHVRVGSILIVTNSSLFSTRGASQFRRYASKSQAGAADFMITSGS